MRRSRLRFVLALVPLVAPSLCPSQTVESTTRKWAIIDLDPITPTDYPARVRVDDISSIKPMMIANPAHRDASTPALLLCTRVLLTNGDEEFTSKEYSVLAHQLVLLGWGYGTVPVAVPTTQPVVTGTLNPPTHRVVNHGIINGIIYNNEGAASGTINSKAVVPTIDVVAAVGNSMRIRIDQITYIVPSPDATMSMMYLSDGKNYLVSTPYATLMQNLAVLGWGVTPIPEIHKLIPDAR